MKSAKARKLVLKTHFHPQSRTGSSIERWLLLSTQSGVSMHLFTGIVCTLLKNGLVVEVFFKEARFHSDKTSSNQVTFARSRLFLCRVLIIGKALGGIKCFLD